LSSAIKWQKSVSGANSNLGHKCKTLSNSLHSAHAIFLGASLALYLCFRGQTWWWKCMCLEGLQQYPGARVNCSESVEHRKGSDWSIQKDKVEFLYNMTVSW